jgi:hypothetical protein
MHARKVGMDREDAKREGHHEANLREEKATEYSNGLKWVYMDKYNR